MRISVNNKPCVRDFKQSLLIFITGSRLAVCEFALMKDHERARCSLTADSDLLLLQQCCRNNTEDSILVSCKNCLHSSRHHGRRKDFLQRGEQ